MNDLIIIGVLICIALWQQVSIHKLVNKLMSRNFHEYETAVNLKKDSEVKIQSPEDIPEDLRHLQELQPF